MPDTTTRDTSPALGSRENWWGDYDATRDKQDGGHEEVDGTSKLDWLAHQLLKNGGDANCYSATTLYEDPDHDGALHDENHEVEMSSPECRIPLTVDRDFRSLDYSVIPHQLRYDTEYGYVGGVVIGDRPMDSFMRVVDDVLDHCQAHDKIALSDSQREELRGRAKRLKEAGRHRDVDVMRLVLEALQSRL